MREGLYRPPLVLQTSALTGLDISRLGPLTTLQDKELNESANNIPGTHKKDYLMYHIKPHARSRGRG